MNRLFPALLILIVLLFVSGCNKAEEIETLEDVQLASEGKEALAGDSSLEPGEPPTEEERAAIAKSIEEGGGVRMPPGKGGG